VVGRRQCGNQKRQGRDTGRDDVGVQGWTPANILAQSSVSITSSAWDSPQLKHLRYLYQLVARARELMRDYSGSDRVGSNRIEANCIEMEMAWGIDPMCTLRRSKED